MVPLHYLPVSSKERALWLSKAPEKLTNSYGDGVSYQALDSRGKKSSATNAACYSFLLRSKLDTYQIHCRPRQQPKAVSLDDAQAFFLIMAQHGVTPEKVHLWQEEDGIHCLVPRKSGPIPNIYAALTCYRWIDSHPPLVWEFLRILEQDVPRHPLQILPCLIERNVRNCNHSFITTKGWRAQLKEFETALNPTLGLAAKIFFDREDPRGEEAFANPETHCNTTIGQISRDISPQIQVQTHNNWGPKEIEFPQYRLRKPEDGLHPGLYPLYTISNITTEQIREVFSKLFTEEKK